MERRKKIAFFFGVMGFLLSGCGFLKKEIPPTVSTVLAGELVEVIQDQMFFDLDISFSGILLEILEGHLSIESDNNGIQIINISEQTIFETLRFDVDGTFIESIPKEKSEINVGQIAAAAGKKTGGEMIAEHIFLFEIEDPIILETEKLNSDFAFLLDVGRGRALLNKRGQERMYPASLTKIMTAWVAIHSLEDLTEQIYIDPEMFAQLQLANASMAGFQAGQFVSARDVLYGIMLPSGGEATLAIASHIGGSVEGFVGMMNDKARDIGLTQTHFTNPIGLHDPNHFSTAEEIASLLEIALKNTTFREIFTTASHVSGSGFTMKSTMFGNMPRTQVTNGEIIGGRTGFTLSAGRCLASLAVINGNEYILVTGGAPNLADNRTLHLMDALYIFDQL